MGIARTIAVALYLAGIGYVLVKAVQITLTLLPSGG